jgi:hypothetical protein
MKYKARIEIEVDAESIEKAGDLIINSLDNIKTGKGHMTIKGQNNSMGQSF